jgi:hypothetical protein
LAQKSNLVNAAITIDTSNQLISKSKIHPKTNNRFLSKEQIQEKSSQQGYDKGYKRGLEDAEKKKIVELRREDSLIKNARKIVAAASSSESNSSTFTSISFIRNCLDNKARSLKNGNNNGSRYSDAYKQMAANIQFKTGNGPNKEIKAAFGHPSESTTKTHMRKNRFDFEWAKISGKIS